MSRTLLTATARVVVTALFAAGVVVVPPTVASAAPEPAAPERAEPATPAERTALDEARETGRQVVVPEHTTETSEVLANPEGTFTLRTSSAPQRVRRGDGWAPVDTSLRANPDGTLSPAAALVDVAFSGGGTAPLIRLADGGRRMSFSWPSPLPAPVVAGEKATYPGVFPGVDLVVSASAVGYSQVLVVHDAAAAANPALLDITLKTRAEGLDLEVVDGVINARGPAGEVVFAGSTAVMWDGARQGGKGPEPTVTDPGAAEVTKLDVVEHRAAGGDELRVKPDRAALTGPGVTYPVYIDPGMSGGQQAWAEVTANGYRYWNAAMDAQVGRCYNEFGQCGSLTVARSYFRLDTGPLQKRNGYTAVVWSAEMWFTQVWGANLCTAQPVSLFGTGGFDSGITWNNQPLGPGGLPGAMETQSSGAGTQCSGPGGVRFNSDAVKNYAQSSANNSWPNVHVALAAPNEGNQLQWKKFATSGAAAPHLDVVFSFPPGPASANGVSNAVGCTGLAITPDSRPTLYGTASDNNNPPLNVALAFEVWDGNGIEMKASGTVSGGSGTRQGWTVPNALPDGGYAYRIAVRNLFPNDDRKDLWNGTYSPWFWFRVQANGPATAPRVISSADYPAHYWGAPKGELGAIQVDSGGASGVVGYTYTFSGAGTEPVPNTSTCDYTPAGSAASGTYAPASETGPTWLPVLSGLSPGYHTLHVRSFDHAHNLSPESAAHVFYVAPNTGQAAVRYEAENQPYAQPAGQGKGLGPQDRCCNLTWSGNRQLSFTGDAAGQSFTVSFDVAVEAAYQVAVGMTKANDYGQVAFKLDGQPIGQPHPDSPVGAAIDGYTPDAINALTVLGTRRLTAGTHTLQLTLTGAHPNSVGRRFTAGLDHITIANTPRYEAELPSQVTPSQPTGQGVPLTVEQQAATNGGPFSQGAQLLFGATAKDRSFDLAFGVPTEGDYALGIALSKKEDRGKLRIAVDGIPLRRTDHEPWDGYQATGGRSTFLPLGGAHLKAGQHKLTVTVVGKNDAATGFTAGVDHLTAVAINGITAASFTDAMNNRAIGVDNTTAANADFNNQSLSRTALAAAGLAPGAKVTHGRATFTMPTPNATTGNDNVVALGQTIPFPAHQRVKATSVGLFAFSTCGDTPATTATVTYTDGTTSNPVVPAVPDWVYNTYRSESDAVTLSHRLAGTTPEPNKRSRLYTVFAPTDPTKTLASITLPNTGTAFQPNTCGPAAALHVLSIAPAPVATDWLGSWSAVVDDPRDLSDPAGKTVRMIVHPAKRGTTLRLKLSNTDSDVPSSVLRVTVAAQTGTGAASLAAPVAVTFGGAQGVTMPARGDVYSDEVPFPTTAGGSGELLVSIALPASAPEVPFTYGTTARWFAASGEVTGNADGAPFAGQVSMPGTYLLTGVEVKPAGVDQGTVAVISDRSFGYGDRSPAFSPRWSELLADQMGDRMPGSLVHAGYSYAEEATEAPHRYALGQPNVRTALISMNTLWSDETLGDVRQELTDLMGVNNANGLRNHRRSDGSPLSVIITTIPPTGLDPADPEEVLRKQVNELIRTSYVDLGADQMVDFDAAVRDPNAPHEAQPQLVHPDGGWPLEAYDQRLAQAVVDAVDGFPPLTF